MELTERMLSSTVGNNPMPELMTIGVDIGGTKVAAGLVDSTGQIIQKARVPMVATADAATGFAAVKGAVEALFARAPEARTAIKGIGICSPGPLDPRTGVVLNPPNVPCWRNFPLGAETERAFGAPTKVDNDANAAQVPGMSAPGAMMRVLDTAAAACCPVVFCPSVKST